MHCFWSERISNIEIVRSSLSVFKKQLSNILFTSLKNGKQYDYRGAREITNFVNFIEGGYLQSEGESLPSLEVLNAPKAPLPQYFEWALQLAVTLLFSFTKLQI